MFLIMSVNKWTQEPTSSPQHQRERQTKLPQNEQMSNRVGNSFPKNVATLSLTKNHHQNTPLTMVLIIKTIIKNTPLTIDLILKTVIKKNSTLWILSRKPTPKYSTDYGS